MREQSLVTTKRKILQIECDSLIVVAVGNMGKLVRLKGDVVLLHQSTNQYYFRSGSKVNSSGGVRFHKKKESTNRMATSI